VVPSLDVVDVVGREGAADAAAAIESYDLICCCTTSREPLFDSARVADGATVVAIGSHERDAREVDGVLAGRATVVVESRATALREAGDVILAVGEGALREDALVELADVVRGGVAVDRAAGPVFFKSTGMAWEDAVVASAVVAGT
jgi:ornithine cyclodeaminase/alanine dehydrogenase-like protein (mu-crystallin family)